MPLRGPIASGLPRKPCPKSNTARECRTRRPTLDGVRQIRAFNRGRGAERLALMHQAMRANAFGFLRGIRS